MRLPCDLTQITPRQSSQLAAVAFGLLIIAYGTGQWLKPKALTPNNEFPREE